MWRNRNNGGIGSVAAYQIVSIWHQNGVKACNIIVSTALSGVAAASSTWRNVKMAWRSNSVIN